MTKKSIVILVLATIILATIPIISAAPDLTDEWLIENAINGVLAVYTDIPASATFKGTVVSGWHNHNDSGKWHKEVELKITYTQLHGSNKYRHTINWAGRSYYNERIYTKEFSHSTKKWAPRLQLKTTIVNPQYRQFWNGKQWEDNIPIITIVDGRTYVTYPKLAT